MEAYQIKIYECVLGVHCRDYAECAELCNVKCAVSGV